MSRPGAAVAVILAGFVLLWVVFRPPTLPVASSGPAPQNLAAVTAGSAGNQPAAPVAVSRDSQIFSSASIPSRSEPQPFSKAPNPAVPSTLGLEFTNLPPAIVLDNMRLAVRQYGAMFGGNPVGTNPEITRALNGNNPRQAKFLDPEAGLRINEKGELTDPWGTPFFFHQLSGAEMEIHSAGPDKIMWTADDLVTK